MPAPALSPHKTQLLEEEEAAANSGLSEAELQQIYRAMLTTRILDGKAMSMQRQGRIGFYVPCAGQEAAQIGSAFALRAKEDWLFPTYRDTGVAIARGISLPTLLHHLMGDAKDPMQGRQMPNHWGFREANYMSIASTIAAHLPVAAGVAMGIKLRQRSEVVMSYHGDGATSEGDFHCAYNFAGVYKLPLVFICENNGWAISLPASQQTASHTFAEKAQAYGFSGKRVDGNDVLAVYRAAREAVDKARRGEGPSMIECLTYRLGPHSTSDDPNKYRTKEELESWKQKDPVESFRAYLEKRGAWSEQAEQELRGAIEKDLNAAIAEAASTAAPKLDSMFRDVYAELPWNLEEQLQAEEKSSSQQE